MVLILPDQITEIAIDSHTSSIHPGMQVTLTDNAPPVLRQLRRSVQATLALQSEPQPGPSQQHGDDAGPGTAAEAGCPPAAHSHSEAAWDPEDADSCDDLDDFTAAGSGAADAAEPGSHQRGSSDGSGGWDWVRSAAHERWHRFCSESHFVIYSIDAHSASTCRVVLCRNAWQSGGWTGMMPFLPPAAPLVRTTAQPAELLVMRLQAGSRLVQTAALPFRKPQTKASQRWAPRRACRPMHSSRCATLGIALLPPAQMLPLICSGLSQTLLQSCQSMKHHLWMHRSCWAATCCMRHARRLR